MNHVHYTPIDGGTFTTEMLDANFKAISAWSADAAAHINTIESTVNDLVYTVANLSKQVARQNKASVLPYIVGAGIGIYFYRNRQKVQAMMESAKKKAEEQAAQQRKDETIKTESERTDKPND